MKHIFTTRIRYGIIIIICLSCFESYCQNKGIAKGKIVDSLTQAPLGYASISVHAFPGKQLVNGTMSGEQGDFSIALPFGTFYAEINFVGFKPSRTATFELSKDKPVFDFTFLRLSQTAGQLKEVVVQAEKSSMELALDKKIFNVGKDLANSGGTATDVLTNIPSVAVDPEGNIKLRGSDNVRILIDGKPSGLVSFKGGSGLQQLQASMIERVEVITNPSARYEAEGLGGIINIVLKKDNTQGFNGSIDVIAGHPDNYGLAANLNYRHRKINFFINYGLAYRNQPGRGSLYQEVYDDDTTFILKQTNTSNLRGLNNNIRGGLDFYFTEKSILTGSYLFRRSDVNRITDIVYNDYLFSTSNLVSYSTRRQDEDEVEPNSEYSLIYKKVLEGKGHELLAEVKFLDNWESSDQLFTQYQYLPDGTEDQSKALTQKSLNDESEKQYLFQIDYTRPVAKEGKFEAGLRTSFRDMVNDYTVTQQNSDGTFEPLPGLDNVFFYDENISAAYAIIGNKTKHISYQAGLRAEWTDVKTTLAETGKVNPRNYANLFPSAHVTFDLPKENGIQVSYSRRVRRPYYNDLSPFMTFSDNRNFFSGNPDLDPEFSNVFEIGHVKYTEIGSISSSVYNRNTSDKIDNIRTVYEDGNSVTITENLLSENAYGAEFASTLDLTKWWKWDVNLNFFYAEIDGSNIDETYKTYTYSWFTRTMSRFSLPKQYDIQLRANYEAPQKTAQGRRKSLYYVDFAISKEILKGNGTLNLNILDVFNSRQSRNVFEGDIFYSDRNFQQRRRQVNLTFNYRIKRSKGKTKRGEESVEGF